MIFLSILACMHAGIPMPGHPRAVGTREIQYPAIEMDVPSVSQGGAVQDSSSENNRTEQISESALLLSGRKTLDIDGQTFRYDCSGFVIAAYSMANVPLSGNTRSLYQLAVEKKLLSMKVIEKGDVIFFDNTYDRNRNHKLDDELSHIAVVTNIRPDYTIEMMHLGGSGIVPLYMNIEYPDVHRNEAGEIINSYIRVNRKGEISPNLTGQLFRGAGSLWKLEVLN